MKKNLPRKVAIFTEGQTEQIFVRKLLIELAGQENVHVTSLRAFGGKRFQRIFYDMAKETPDGQLAYHAIIYDCGSEGRVTSDVRDQYRSLIDAGFTEIIAIRDVAPNFTRDQSEKIRSGFDRSIFRDPIVPKLVLATMEVEAWFIGETSHFGRIDASLDVDRILQEVGLDIANDDIEGIERPANELNKIYGLVGLAYTKRRDEVERTVSSLNFNIVRHQLGERTPSIGPLTEALTLFMR